MKLTSGQREVLRAAQETTTILKSNWPGALWRNFDQLVERGLLTRRAYGMHEITQAGRTALANKEDR